MNHIFQTTIKDLISRNKFFQCFVCYDQFNSTHKYPMEICKNHHYMCDDCVKSRAFKSKTKNLYRCGLCSVPIKITQIRRNPFILSIKEFFENLIGREETSRLRYKEYMENQQKIVQILIEENQQVLNESQKQKKDLDKQKKDFEKQKKEVQKHKKEAQKYKKEVQKLKQKIKELQNKHYQKGFVQKDPKKLTHHNEHKQQFDRSQDSNSQFEKLVAQKDNQKSMAKHSIFRSNMFDSSQKGDKLNINNEEQEFVPHPGFSQIYYQNNNMERSAVHLRPESVLSRLIQEGRKIKQNLISEELQSKIKLKQSLKQLQTHNKYIDISEQKLLNNHEDQDNIQFIEKHVHNEGRPQKKVHVDEIKQKPEKQQKPPQNKNNNPRFPFY